MTKPLPKILEEEDKKWRELGFQLVYVGKFPKNPDVDVYRTNDISGRVRETGFPTAYIVSDTDYVERHGFDAFDLINETMEFAKKQKSL